MLKPTSRWAIEESDVLPRYLRWQLYFGRCFPFFVFYLGGYKWARALKPILLKAFHDWELNSDDDLLKSLPEKKSLKEDDNRLVCEGNKGRNFSIRSFYHASVLGDGEAFTLEEVWSSLTSFQGGPLFCLFFFFFFFFLHGIPLRQGCKP